MALDIARIRAICFDIDGTLSDTDDQWVAAFEKRLTPFRRVFAKGEVRPFARWAIMCAETPGNLLYSMLDRANLDDDLGRLYNFLARRGLGKRSRQFWIVEGVRDALLQLHVNYPLAVVSARDHGGTQAFLSQYDLTSMFSVIATAMTCQHTKPFPDPIFWAASQLGVPAENCLMVGDTSVDIRAGRSAGAQTVGVLSGFGQEAALRRAGADLILPSTAALAAVLLASKGAVENV